MRFFLTKHRPILLLAKSFFISNDVATVATRSACEIRPEVASMIGRPNWPAFAMDQWTGVHRAFVIRAYYKSNDSISAAQRLFKRQFNVFQVPPAPVVKSWVRNFECTGSSNGVCVQRVSLPQILCSTCNANLSGERKTST